MLIHKGLIFQMSNGTTPENGSQPTEGQKLRAIGYFLTGMGAPISLAFGMYLRLVLFPGRHGEAPLPHSHNLAPAIVCLAVGLGMFLCGLKFLKLARQAGSTAGG